MRLGEPRRPLGPLAREQGAGLTGLGEPRMELKRGARGQGAAFRRQCDTTRQQCGRLRERCGHLERHCAEGSCHWLPWTLQCWAGNSDGVQRDGNGERATGSASLAPAGCGLFGPPARRRPTAARLRGTSVSLVDGWAGVAWTGAGLVGAAATGPEVGSRVAAGPVAWSELSGDSGEFSAQRGEDPVAQRTRKYRLQVASELPQLLSGT
jgi:hypothetical protein